MVILPLCVLYCLYLLLEDVQSESEIKVNNVKSSCLWKSHPITSVLSPLISDSLWMFSNKRCWSSVGNRWFTQQTPPLTPQVTVTNRWRLFNQIDNTISAHAKGNNNPCMFSILCFPTWTYMIFCYSRGHPAQIIWRSNWLGALSTGWCFGKQFSSWSRERNISGLSKWAMGLQILNFSANIFSPSHS